MRWTGALLTHATRCSAAGLRACRRAAGAPPRITRARAAGRAGWAAAVDDWHAAARRGLAALHFRQLALAPLAAHQAGAAPRMWPRGWGSAAARGVPVCLTRFRRLPAWRTCPGVLQSQGARRAIAHAVA
jgi:predicted TIM-barrel fold metal-dependent hydrolase